MTIKEYCKQRGITITELAREMQVSQCHLSQIARGVTNPSFKMSKKIESYTRKQVPRTLWYPNE